MAFEMLPGSAIGPINCPEPPATVRTVEGRIYECRPEEGQDPYVDVTPPDDETHWRLPFGSSAPPPRGTGSYHPPEEWPFRSIISHGNPAAHNREHFYIFDRQGVVIDSNAPHAIGNQMPEVRISGVRMWPTARVYYPMPPFSDKEKHKSLNPLGQLADTGRYAFVVDGRMLCPALDETHVSAWPLSDTDSSPAFNHLNGHCGSAYQVPSRFSDDDARNSHYYAYPGFKAGGLDLRWSFQRHDEPERPILNRKGECVALCRQDVSKEQY
ncbi:MAG: hypothetical protein GAK31_03983 [Stenotrophomonas maltophilia]|uniref:Uncharacterized protein n=1 Tax=Stenotrophomonas maltophilia TaxID=40324 RepID=A0A7V8FD25_STEMA|nr:MAG: hypothetical protein GAK31_03983 [Stenotrophomonas maltophilia]